MTELQFMAKCYMWFQEKLPEYRGQLFRVKNELDNKTVTFGREWTGTRWKAKLSEKDVRQLNENQTTGVYPGVSDFIFVGRGFVAFIELKIPGGYQSQDQKDWQKLVQNYEHPYYVVKTLEDFKKLILCLIEL